MMDYTEIDGSLLEGGGQLLRISVGLASLLTIPVKIVKIRGGRSKPGLKAQHLSGLRLIDGLSGEDSKLSGARLDSTEISFSPSGLKSPSSRDLRTYDADTKTAGSICLLAQVSLPRALFMPHPCVLELKGGTDATMAPTVDYFRSVFLPNLKRFFPPSSSPIEIDVLRKGYFPKGGGHVRLRVTPLEEALKGVVLEERGRIDSVTISASVAGSLPVSLARRIASSAEKRLREYDICEDIRVRAFKEESAFGNGSSVTVVATSTTGCVFGGSAIGSPKVSPEETGMRAAEDLWERSAKYPAACVDSYVQDQLILFMALADGASRIRTPPLTLHAETAIHVIEKLTDCKFEVKRESDQHCVIGCKGIGFTTK